MKTIRLSATMLVFCWAGAYGQGRDSLTGLPVIPAAETMLAGTSYGFQPGPMPEGTVCKSKMKGDFYALQNMNVKDSKVKVNTVVAWYAAHLLGFKKAQGYVKGPQNAGYISQTAFYNAQGTIVVFITGAVGQQGEDTVTHSVAYERFDPGISEATIASLAQGKIDCR
jgi:hypothetical protein